MALVLLLLLFTPLVSSENWADSHCQYDNVKKITICKKETDGDSNIGTKTASTTQQHQQQHQQHQEIKNPKKKSSNVQNGGGGGGKSKMKHKDDTVILATSEHKPSDHIMDLNHVLNEGEKIKELPLLIPHGEDTFFQGKGSKGNKKANWDYIKHSPEAYSNAWHSSWSPDGDYIYYLD